MLPKPATPKCVRAWNSRLCQLLILFCVGCSSLRNYVDNGFKVGPKYQDPAVFVNSEWIDGQRPADHESFENNVRWWMAFNDDRLNELVEKAVRQNLTVREAGFRVLQAQASLNIARGSLFPQSQGISGSYSRNAASQLSANSSFHSTRFYDDWGTGFNASWELDFWGGYRRAVESTDARLEATAREYDAVVVTLLADVASAYVSYRTFETQLRLVEKNIATLTKLRDIAAARLKAEADDELDLRQAETNLMRAKALAPQFESQMRIAANQLCVLLGMPPGNLDDLLQRGEIPVPPRHAAIGVPADLLNHRPDVMRAERLVAAQCAQIGVAKAELYPHISIGGSLGWAAEDFDQLMQNRALSGYVAPSFKWNILNYGRLKNNVRLQDAKFQELLASYRNIVLRAGREVEDGLVRFSKAEQRVAYLEKSVEAARRAEKLVVTQYIAGVTDFNRVAVVQEDLIEAQDILAQADGEVCQSLIYIYRSIGGGWQICHDQ